MSEAINEIKKQAVGVLESAKTFIYSSARLLDRKRFSYHFENSSQLDVLNVLEQYQNSDGGFGNALEPDMRGPHSQPVTTEMAMGIMKELDRFDETMLAGVLTYLKSITIAGGGLPRATTDVNAYPHAPWWSTESDNIPSINPTGIIIGLLMGQTVRNDFKTEEWFQSHNSFLWRCLDDSVPSDYHDYLQWMYFLQNTPDRQKAQLFESKLDNWLAESGAIEKNPAATGYSHKVLDYAPKPNSYASRFVTEDEVVQSLRYLVQSQQEDGGWSISWPAVSVAAEQEWRGWVTVDRLLTLRAYGVI
jgi:hypothetical protein